MKANDKYSAFRDEQRLARQLAARHDHEEMVRRDNEAFAAMSPANKRVAIARDVLKWIEFGKLIPTNGSYLTVEDDRLRERRSATVNGFQCHACALGAVFAVAVDRAAFTVRNVNAVYDWQMHDKLSPFFSTNQLIEIEDAFESFNRSGSEASDFCRDIPKMLPDGEVNHAGARERMRRIMQNIIDNGGEFVP